MSSWRIPGFALIGPVGPPSLPCGVLHPSGVWRTTVAWRTLDQRHVAKLKKKKKKKKNATTVPCCTLR
jgi:hypothetical protein